MPPRQLDVEGVEVDVVDALKELGGPGVGQGLGQVVSPSAPARALPRGQVLGSEARPPERAPGASHGSTARRTTSSFMSTRGLKPSPLTVYFCTNPPPSRSPRRTSGGGFPGPGSAHGRGMPPSPRRGRGQEVSRRPSPRTGASTCRSRWCRGTPPGQKLQAAPRSCWKLRVHERRRPRPRQAASAG